MDWIQNNLLALYGAIVGTIALVLNFGRFLLMRQKSVRKLKVESTVDKDAQRQLDQLTNPREYGRGTLCGPIYKVSVINVSHVPVHVHDVGLLIKVNGKLEKLQVYVSSGSHGFLSHLDEAEGQDIAAGARQSFSIWLSSNPVLPEIIGCYATNQLGKEFKGKHQFKGVVLTVPEIPKELNNSMPPTANASVD